MRLLLLLILLANTCNKSDSEITFRGRIEKQGITTYQYGTHTISDGKITYALRSATVNLDKYEGREVEIEGKKVEGYPIEGGPDFLEVSKVME